MKTFNQLQGTESVLYPSKSLNPRLWNNDNSLNGTIRNQIIDRARLYVEKLGLPPNSIQDLRIVGGSASYNWSDTSDIDVTIQLDRDLDLDKKQVRKLGRDSTFLTYKLAPKIEGLDLNFYISSRNVGGLRPANQSIYSIFENDWMMGPTSYHESSPNYVTTKAADLIQQIEECVDDSDGDAGSCAKNLLDKLKRYRLTGLKSSDGEFSQPSIVWRLISRSGYIAQLKDKVSQLEQSYKRLKNPDPQAVFPSNSEFSELLHSQNDLNKPSYAMAKWGKRILLGDDPLAMLERIKPILMLFLATESSPLSK